MSSGTLILIIFAGIIALLLALFQYWGPSKRNSKKNGLFVFLRFITLFAILLLIINPKFENLEVYSEKPNLVVAVDNSTSIKHLNQSDKVFGTFNEISTNTDLTNKFNKIGRASCRKRDRNLVD